MIVVTAFAVSGGGIDLLVDHASPRFRCPAHFLLPSRSPFPAALGQVLPLLELPFFEVAANDGVAVPIDAVGEVLASHADAGSFPIAQIAIVHVIPVLHGAIGASTPVLN